MPLSGGAADKFGNRYEALWTAYCLLRILHEEALSIYLEPVGTEGEGVEFVLRLPAGVREYHQVKRQHDNPWSLSALAAKNVLVNFRNKLTAPDAVCVFVSSSSADSLRELAERARSARNLTEFRKYFAETGKPQATFPELVMKWPGCTDDEAFGYLKRISVESIGESTLNREVEHRASSWIVGEPALVCDALLSLALHSIHQELDEIRIWQYLEGRGFRRRALSRDPHVLSSVEAANRRYLDPIRTLAIFGKLIPRTEVSDIIAKLEMSSTKQAILISGSAGAGKTGTLGEVLEHFQANNWPVLALRMDGLEPCQTTHQLGRQMDLPGSPVTVLAEIAGGRPSLLLIDQLDAVSTVSGRNPQFFDRVGDMLGESGIHPQMRVLLSCRHFDLQNDGRLRRLVEQNGVAEEVRLERLSRETVRETVTACGVDANRLTVSQETLLSLPLHLKVFTEILGRPGSNCEEDTAPAVLLERMADRMMRTQALFVPAGGLEDDFDTTLRAMASEGVLVQEGRRVSFFHETFFDYVFARRFVARESRLIPFLLGQEQHLFLRATVRQILAHEREDFYDSHYLEDLKSLLIHDGIRFHLKHLALQWLRSLPVPRSEEWAIVREVMLGPDVELAAQGRCVILSSPWFRLLDRLGYVNQELDCGDEGRQKAMVEYLATSVREEMERVGEITLPWLDRPGPWPTYAIAVLARADVDKCRQFVDIYLRLVENDFLNQMSSPFSGHDYIHFYDLPEKQPEWAIEVLEAWIRQQLRMTQRQDSMNSFDDSREHDYGARIESMARSAPESFVRRILPLIIEIVENSAISSVDDMGPLVDPVWKRGDLLSRSHDTRQQILYALARAIGDLALYYPDRFQEYEGMLRSKCRYHTCGKLLAYGYALGTAATANDAVEFLLSNPAWLHLGFGSTPCWLSRMVIESATLYCSDILYRQLEGTLLGFYPDWERPSRGLRGNLGYSQRILLAGMAVSRRSQLVKIRLGELDRQFGEPIHQPQAMATLIRSVGPPFNADWAKMTDGHWLRAMKKYDTETYRSHDILKGGAYQLGSVLRQEAKKNPARFAALLSRIPTDVNPNYFDSILWGITEAPKIEPERIWDILRYCHVLPGRPCARSIERVVLAYSHEDVPLDILELVAWYAAEAPDPAGNDHSDLEHCGLNSDRGSMALAVSSLLFEHPDYVGFFRPCLEQMVADPSEAVRSQVARALLPVLNADRDYAVSLFLLLCDVEGDALLGTRFIPEFLHYACHTHLPMLLPLIERMVSSEVPSAVEAGTYIACGAALIDTAAETLADSCLCGAESMRKAASDVAAANVRSGPNRPRSVSALKTFFNDESKDVRTSAAHCFRQFQGDDLADFTDLVSSFIASRAFEEETFGFFHALEETTALLPDEVCLAFERSIELMSSISTAERVRSGRFMDHDGKILLRLYDRTTDQGVKRRCLDLIDQISRHDTFFVDTELTERDF